MRRIVTFLLITLFFTLSGCGKLLKEQPNSLRVVENNLNGELVNIILYYPDKNSEHLIPEERLAAFNKSYENTVLEELLKGPRSQELTNPIPKETKLLSMDRDGDKLIVNLSEEFIKNHPGGSTGEVMSVFSIVNTLTEIPGIKSVSFKINGKAYETIKGHISFNKPFKRDRSMFKRDKSLNPAEVMEIQMTYEKQGRWLEAYMLMSDDENNNDRKYYHEYVRDMEEVAGVGFTDQDFRVGEYSIDESKALAKVKVNFITKQEDGGTLVSDDIFFRCVKIEGCWMVDWLTEQA